VIGDTTQLNDKNEPMCRMRDFIGSEYVTQERASRYRDLRKIDRRRGTGCPLYRSSVPMPLSAGALVSSYRDLVVGKSWRGGNATFEFKRRFPGPRHTPLPKRQSWW